MLKLLIMSKKISEISNFIMKCLYSYFNRRLIEIINFQQQLYFKQIKFSIEPKESLLDFQALEVKQ